MPRKALVNTKRNVLMPPGHPIILLKSNLFNMAAARSVKRSIIRIIPRVYSISIANRVCTARGRGFRTPGWINTLERYSVLTVRGGKRDLIILFNLPWPYIHRQMWCLRWPRPFLKCKRRMLRLEREQPRRHSLPRLSVKNGRRVLRD